MELGPEGTTALGLNDIISAIRKAKNNDMIKDLHRFSIDVCLHGHTGEIRNELVSFKESGSLSWPMPTPILKTDITGSNCRQVAINPQEASTCTDWLPVPMFYKDALDKLGIEMRIFKVGTYKSAVEPFTQNR